MPTCFIHFIVIDINNGLKSQNLIHTENLCLNIYIWHSQISLKNLSESAYCYRNSALTSAFCSDYNLCMIFFHNTHMQVYYWFFFTSRWISFPWSFKLSKILATKWQNYCYLNQFCVIICQIISSTIIWLLINYNIIYICKLMLLF